MNRDLQESMQQIIDRHDVEHVNYASLGTQLLDLAESAREQDGLSTGDVVMVLGHAEDAALKMLDSEQKCEILSRVGKAYGTLGGEYADYSEEIFGQVAAIRQFSHSHQEP